MHEEEPEESGQLQLPLEWSKTPFTVVVKVEDTTYEIATVPDEPQAAHIMDNVARLVEETTGIQNLHKVDAFWYGVLPLPHTEGDGRPTHTMWRAFYMQKKGNNS